MGRIEDAVRKIQRGEASKRARSPSRQDDDESKLGTIVTEALTFEGKRIEVDFDQLRKHGLLAPDSEAHGLAEQYRAIKRPILRNADSRREPPLPLGNVIAVTSALSGEGKTFTCVNLCLSMARERDWDVVLIDADCSKPHLTRLFSAEAEPGLLDLLREPGTDFQSFVMPTDIDGFSIMPAGTLGSDAAELLGSQRMGKLCRRLSEKQSGRLIVFDTSPLLLTTEAATLAANVGQIAFVVRADVTPQPSVLAALELLDSRKAIGCILNQSHGSVHGEGAADGYGYGYGYGYGNSVYGTKDAAGGPV